MKVSSRVNQAIDSAKNSIIIDVPANWESRRFRDTFIFSKGLNITKKDLAEDGIPCINYGEIHSKYGFEVDPLKDKLKCVGSHYLESNSKSLLAIGDIVFADTSEDIEGSGNFTQLTSEVVSFAGYHTVVARPKAGCNNRFLAYLLESESYTNQIKRAVKGVKVFSITKAILKNTKLWFPCLEQQTEIANFLDKKTAQIDEAIAIKEKQIELLKERKQIIIQKAVTQGLDPNVPMKDSGVNWIGYVPSNWNVVKLKNLIKKLESGVSVNASESDAAFGEEIGVLKTSAVYNYKFDFRENKKVFETELKRVSCSVKAGSIIISRMNAPELVGASGFVDNDHPNLFLPDRLWQARFNTVSSLIPKYVSKVLTAKGFRGVIESIATGSSPSMKNISKGDLLNVFIGLPPEEEIVSIIGHLEKMEVIISDSINLKTIQIQKLKEYKTTLINSAVTGKIKITPE